MRGLVTDWTSLHRGDALAPIVGDTAHTRRARPHSKTAVPRHQTPGSIARQEDTMMTVCDDTEEIGLIKQANFDAARRGVFRYAVFAHQYERHWRLDELLRIPRHRGKYCATGA